jgi:ribosomal protein L7/L12
MFMLRFLSGFFWVAGLVWFIPSAWSLYMRDQIDLDAWHRLMAACAFFAVAALVNIYEKLDQIAKAVKRADSASMLAQRQPLSARVKQLAIDPNNKIEAIKVYREETGASLAEAKEVVEAFINNVGGISW